MKVRKGFVSNSSSSSFVVIDFNGPLDSENCAIGEEWNCRHLEYGQTEFDWDVADLYDTHTKINFAYLQALYADNDEWEEMIGRVISEHTGAVNAYSGFFMNDWGGVINGSVDHQSVGGKNTAIFADETTLKHFLFGSASFVHTDNDNY